MALAPKLTPAIQIGAWTTVQMWASAGHQLANTVPSDSAGGKDLVMERGIWKYPQQDGVGAFVIPATNGKPVKLLNVMADLGASTVLKIHVAGPADNTTGTPYAGGDAALYREGDIVIYDNTAAAARYISINFNTTAGDISAIIFPGQTIYAVSTAGTAPLIRFTFALATDNP